MRTELLQRPDASNHIWARLGLVEVPHGWSTSRYGHQSLEVLEYLRWYVSMCAYMVDYSTHGRLGALLAYSTRMAAVDACECEGGHCLLPRWRGRRALVRLLCTRREGQLWVTHRDVERLCMAWGCAIVHAYTLTAHGWVIHATGVIEWTSDTP